MTLPTYLLPAATAAVILLALGCGSSSNKAPATMAATTAHANVPTAELATGAPLTRAQLVARGDAICARANAKLETTPIASRSDYARVLPQAALYDRTEASELSKLVPPAAMMRDWSSIVNGVTAFAYYTGKVAEAAETGQFASATPLVLAGEKVHAALTTIAKRDGFKDCSQI